MKIEIDEIINVFKELKREAHAGLIKKRGPYLPIEKKRSEFIHVTINKEQKSELLEKARARGCTLSTYVQNLIIKDLKKN